MGTTAAQNAISADKPACDVNPGALLTKPTLSSRCEQLCTAASLDLLQQAVAKPPPYCLVVDGKLFSAQNTTQDVFTLVDVTKLASSVSHIEGLPSIGLSISFAHNRLTDLPSTWPPYLQTLNLQHNALTQVNFTALPPSLSFVCLGGNNITLIAASSAAFEVLKKLSQPHADAGHASSTCDDSAPFASPNLPTPQCPPPTKLETLWGVYPICVTPPTTSSSPDGTKSGASVVVVSVALALIMLLLLAICIQRRRARLSPNWY
ncbi:hypothetical protein DYB35_011295, partial [Aphanomyces astaci]